MRLCGEDRVDLFEGLFAGEDEGVVVCETVAKPFVEFGLERVRGGVGECVFGLL